MKKRKTEKKDKQSGKFEWLQNLMTLVIAVVVVFLLERFVLMPTRVSGVSMYPTFQSGDFLLVNRMAYVVGEPKRFDIIVFEETRDDKEELLIKRVIALPGETVMVSDSKIIVDGEELEEYFYLDHTFDGKDMTGPVVLGEDEYFVMGDHRQVSLDSRSDKIGTIHKSQIVGEAVFRLFPLKDFGVLTQP